jgi:hypothetical protein
MGDKEDKESRQLKLVDGKKGKKPREKGAKKWVGVVLLITILLSLGFYFVAGDGMEEIAGKLRRKKQVEMDSKVIVPQEQVLEESLWERVSKLWGPVVYEF